MAGAAFSLTTFTPIHPGHDHSGKIDIFTANFYGLYGLTNKFNLTFNLPYKHWTQYKVAHADKHHRNESLAGPGDLTLGVRGIIINESFGPGERFFIDSAIRLPTGRGYKVNPFSEAADSIAHSHFAIGTGQITVAAGIEWWRRWEFPFILGVSARFEKAVGASQIGFAPGPATRFSLHAIRQKPLLPAVFPYLRLDLRREWPDRWDGKAAPNSGALFVDGFAQLIFEANESSSFVLTIGRSLWWVVEGSQLASITYALSYRFQPL